MKFSMTFARSLLLAALLQSGPAFSAAVDAFTLTPNAAISGYNRERVSNATPESCAAACQDSTRGAWCVSFDYERAQRWCDLSDRRAADVGGLKTDYAGNPYDHYSLKPNPLAAFQVTRNAAISGYNNEQLQNVQPADCAAACTASSRSWCKSFDYNKTLLRCDLSDKRASDVGGLKTDYAGNPYDHYALVAGDTVPNPIPGKKHVLVIGLDGLRGDAILCSTCVATPAMSALAAGGAYHRNVLAGGTQQTVSGPGWASVFTGFWADQHGVASNATNLPLRKPHVFDQIKQAYPTATTAIVGDWYNITNNLKPALADFVVANAAKNSQQATDTVKNWLSWTNPPTAIFYYLHRTDIHAASYDPNNAYYRSQIAAEDQQIQQVLDALTARANYANEDWLIVVTSDHGGAGSGHGGQTAGERSTPLVLNNTYQRTGKTPYCAGDLGATPMLQIDGATPHILDFLNLTNLTQGRKHASCGTPLNPVKRMDGTAGRDTLSATADDDVITGGEVADTITGGAGKDVFVYQDMRDAGDTILDFAPGVDRIDLRALLTSLGYAGTNGIADGYVRLVANAAGVIVQIDADGPAGPAAPRPLVQLKGTSLASLDASRDFIY